MSKISVVWDYFTLTGDQVKCGLCRDSLCYNRSSTSNMMRHLRTKHMSVNLSKRKGIDDEEVDDPRTETTEPTLSSNVVSICMVITNINKISVGLHLIIIHFIFDRYNTI